MKEMKLMLKQRTWSHIFLVAERERRTQSYSINGCLISIVPSNFQNSNVRSYLKIFRPVSLIRQQPARGKTQHLIIHSAISSILDLS